MDIFKLFFNHDLRLDQFGDDSSPQEKGTLEDFMTPTPTYSRFYLAGSRIENEQFGLSTLNHLEDVFEQLEEALKDFSFASPSTNDQSLHKLLPKLSFEEPAVGTPSSSTDISFDIEQLYKTESGIRDIKEEISDLLTSGAILLYKEQAPDGYDIQMFSLDNRYEALFNTFKPLIDPPSFRFFSINSKRINSKRKFYFEAVDLQRPPHGVEEVHQNTTL